MPIDQPSGEVSAYPTGSSFTWPPGEPHPHAGAYGLPAGHVYGSDDDPAGPPAPPLQHEVLAAGELPREIGPLLVACPTCGTGVDPDRLRG